jgi:hypothetical protein
MTLGHNWSTAVEEADWLKKRLAGFDPGTVVASVVPSGLGYEAVSTLPP